MDVNVHFRLDANDHTVHFKEQLRSEKYQHIWLVSCSFFNTWFNLRWTREISVFDALGTPIVKRISEGNYWLKSLGQALHDTLKSDGVKVEMNTPKGGILKISISSKIHILKVSISFLTMMWLILLGLKDVCKSSTESKGLHHLPTTLSAVIFLMRMKTYSMESPQAFLDALTLSGNPLTGLTFILKPQLNEK